MARKIRFGLNMPEKQNVRTLEELQQYFNLKAVLEYYFNNKLTEWLNDRGYTHIAEELDALDRSKDDFEENICKILGAQYKAEAAETVTAEAVEALVDRKEEIRRYTDDIHILENADKVAFSQEELDELLKADSSATVYLLGKEFTLSSQYKNKTYIGLNNPAVKCDDIPEVTLRELGIKLAGVKVSGDAIKLMEETAKPEEKRRGTNTGYKVSGAFDSLLNDEQRSQSEKLFNCIEKGLGSYEFNPDIKSNKLLNAIESSDLRSYEFNPDIKSNKLLNAIESSGLRSYEFNPDIKSNKLLNIMEGSSLKSYFKNYLDRMA